MKSKRFVTRVSLGIGKGRRAALSVGLAVLAIAVPVAGASAAEPSVAEVPDSGCAVAIGPTLIGTTFNGPTSIVTTTAG